MKETDKRVEPNLNIQEEEREPINIKNLCVCVCTDGEICLFKKERVFDITYSMWVDVYSEIDLKGNHGNRTAIWGKKGDKVFPNSRWLEVGECIVTRDEKQIKANCLIGKAVRGEEIFQMMRKSTGGLYCKTNILTPSDLAQMLKSADRHLRFEKPEPPKQKIKKMGEKLMSENK